MIADIEMATELAETVRFFGAKGWVPATSSNFSFRQQEAIAISISGRDKINFSPEDLMLIDSSMKSIGDIKHKPSAETEIHIGLYELFQPAAVFHTHSCASTVLSMQNGSASALKFQGYEILKGLGDIKSHETEVVVPVYPNSQDMQTFRAAMESDLKQRTNVYGFLIEGHGLYTWGASLAETKRHIEVFEFLFECRLAELRMR